MFRVSLENGHEIIAHLAEKSEFRIRVMVGDKVDVEMTPYDLTKGVILSAISNAGLAPPKTLPSMTVANFGAKLLKNVKLQRRKNLSAYIENFT